MKTKINFILIFLFFIIPFGFVNAAFDPIKSNFDARIRSLNYNSNDVTQINAIDGYTTTIKFDKNENIFYVTTGFESGWTHIVENNYLIIYPKAINNDNEYMPPNPDYWDTNLIVITDKREYLFQLNIVNNKTNMFLVSFNYPNEIAKEQALKINEKKKYYADKNNKELVSKSLSALSLPSNWDYYKSVNNGSESISPDFVYDDGTLTFIGFANNKQIPSVFLVNQDNSEEIVTYNMRPDVINNYRTMVIHGVNEKLMLRNGNKVVGILNKSYGKVKNTKYKTTSNNNVIRVLNK